MFNALKMNKKILVIGSQGYIGTVLTDYLIKKKYYVIGIDNFIYNQKKVFFFNKNYKFIKCYEVSNLIT